MPQETQQHSSEPLPALDPAELTEAELAQVAGGGGDGAEGLQPPGSAR
jgi:hypothetical protein